eukprot:PhM_4_TR7274/c0_g1_i1/m.90751
MTPPLLFQPSFLWSSFWDLLKNKSILKAIDLIGHNFVPFSNFNIEQYKAEITTNTKDAARRYAWKVYFFEHDQVQNNWKPPAWGYISQNTWPKNSARIQSKVSEVLQSFFQEFDLRFHNFQQNQNRNCLHLQTISKALKETPQHLVPIQADKNMGWFWVTVNQLNEIKEREKQKYLAPPNNNFNPIQKFLTAYRRAQIITSDIPEVKSFLQKAENSKKYKHLFERQTAPEVYFLVKIGKLITNNHNIDEEARCTEHINIPLPYRPILPFSACLLYPVTKIVAAIFNSIVPLFDWILKDTDQFVQWWHHTRREHTNTIFIADATNLYGSIPPNLALERMKKILDLPFVQIHMRETWPQFLSNTFRLPEGDRQTLEDSNIILELLKISITNTFLTIKGQTLEQHEGLSMGNPAIPPIANLFLASYEIEHFHQFPERQSIFRRYLDDVAARYDFDTNFYPPCIQLNKEYNANKFLDVQILENGETKVYIKKFAAKPPHWNSNVPKSLKKNFFITQINRATKICSQQEYLSEFRKWLHDEALKRNYPSNIAEEWSEYQIPEIRNRVVDENTIFTVQRIPAWGDTNIIKKLNEEFQNPDIKFARSRQYDRSLNTELQKLMRKRGYDI